MQSALVQGLRAAFSISTRRKDRFHAIESTKTWAMPFGTIEIRARLGDGTATLIDLTRLLCRINLQAPNNQRK
jgi:hypothetical protein